MSLDRPININKWIAENQELLKPPVRNYCIQHGKDFFLMIINGPNERADFHINQTEIKGNIVLRVVVMNEQKQSKIEDIVISEGEVFLLPSNVPHNPIRPSDSIGLVIERVRPPGSLDRLRWYCEKCMVIIHEVAFECTDVQNQLKEYITQYSKDVKLRTCPACRHINPTS